jgi:Inhibitor of vertebrate lysozyme (Ivy)
MRRLRWAIILACTTCAMPAAAADVYLFDVIKKPAYARSLKGLLQSTKDLPFWTPNLLSTRGDYVGTPVDYVTVGGVKYELFNACKPHQCDDSRVEVMFAPNGAQAWAGVYQDGKPIIWLGAPSLSQQAAMQGALQP